MDLKSFIRDIPGFPKPGIIFEDITPLLKSPKAFHESIERLAECAAGSEATDVVGIDARGFIFGAALAHKLGLGFVPIRKPRKLPYETICEHYSLEYGADSIEMHCDALKPGDRVIVIDDLLATGGTMGAAARLVEKTGASVARILFVVELTYLNGRDKLAGYDVRSLVTY